MSYFTLRRGFQIRLLAYQEAIQGGALVSVECLWCTVNAPTRRHLRRAANSKVGASRKSDRFSREFTAYGQPHHRGRPSALPPAWSNAGSAGQDHLRQGRCLAPGSWVCWRVGSRSPRCGARTLTGSRCRSPGDAERPCRMHGGRSPGAQRGNKNALKHGCYTADAIAPRRENSGLVREMKALTKRVDR